MKNVKIFFLLGFVSLLVAASSVRAVNNPLNIPLNDGIVRYNGLFYSMGTQTNGQMLVSTNLVDWGAPTQVLSDRIPGPYELVCYNGTFTLYAEGLGYALAAQPTGPFSPMKKGANLAADDLCLYQNDGGVLIAVSRELGSKKAGEIIGRSYRFPWQASGRAKVFLDGRRGVWDALDSADLGEPDLYGYRNNYYLLYAANNPSPRTGLRQVGVAVNEDPRRFENEDKMPDPLLKRNTERLNRTYTTLLSNGQYSGWEGRYILEKPEADWMQLDAELRGWRSGDGGFGFPFEVDGAELHSCRTKWTTDAIWVRRKFELDSSAPVTPVLNIRHEGPVQVLLNGQTIYETMEPSIAYSNIDVSEAAASAFLPGENVLAVVSMAPKSGGYRFLDFGLMDAGAMAVEPVVCGLNAPRIVTGPNGFEKWIAYQGYWNGKPGTGMDRVFFYEDEMVVDGPTTTNTPGYHPAPARPTFADSFAVEQTNQWAYSAGTSSLTNGMLMLESKGASTKCYLKTAPATHYLLEATIRFPENGAGDVGVVAWSNGERDLIISVNLARKAWSYYIEPGQISPKRLRLPSAFQPTALPKGVDIGGGRLHQLKITKNGGYFDVWLDGIQLTPNKPAITKFTGPGVPGLYVKNTSAAFDSMTYTVGWDEHAEYITGWGAAADGTPPGGEWDHDEDDGLEQKRHSVPGRAFKGDLLDQYEFTVNARTDELEEGDERLYGVFPVFVDRQNYLQAMINTENRELVITGKRRGQNLERIVVSLNRRIPHQHLYDTETAYSDVSDWIYTLRSESVISGLDIRWLEGEYDYLQQEYFVPADDLQVGYAKLKRGRQPVLWDDGRFYNADEPKPEDQVSSLLNRHSIRPETATHVGFELYISSAIVINSRTGRYIRDYVPGEELGNNEEVVDDTMESDTPSRPQETLVLVEVESSYFFRCVKLKDRVIIELNGQPMLTLEGEWPPSQVGLVTEGQPCFFNGITLNHLPQ